MVEKSQKNILLNYFHFHFEIQVSKKLCWNIAIPIHLCIICDCFGIVTAELNSCDRDHLAHKA